ncbi:unnamed protein product [Parascedosporium putredinis]|uniref:Uncharacterized protein n=1 Tax=Parascedosporium putredinis TaxID=1442378 RepID=A0A9P1H8Q4_9PEZI|nr:unnamed protein product [Parascedosporium putredinis]CAI7999566.1 unnamed protein product [Parascedosporium putredinis]
MSSPDPLNESLTSSVARRITRSQQAKHFVSLGNSSSPRKQTFELEVGDNTSPQKLFVTVESGLNTGDARRRLFTSSSSPTKSTPSIRRRERATTTTIPLKGISEVDDDGLDLPAVTPRRRGRPPKSAVGSTPKPVALKRRSGTPVRKATPGRPRKSQNQDADDDLPSEISVATATPRTARGRKATRATSTEPSTIPITQGTLTPKRKTVTKRKTVDDEASSVPPSSARRRGRPRKKPLLGEATQLEATLPTLPESQVGLSVPQNRAVNASLSPMHSEMDIDTPGLPAPASEGDIWMDTLSDGITPRLAPRMRSLNLSSTLDLRKSTASHAETTVASNFEGQADEEAAVVTDDFGASLHRDSTPLASRETTAEPETDIDVVDMIVRDHPTSDFPSEASEHGEESNRMPRGDKDTIVQSEEFSMIFMDSIPSLQSSMFGRAPTEVGEETNLLINRTIEAIKNGMEEEESEEEHEAAAEVGDVEQPKGDIEEDEGDVTVTQEMTRNAEMDDEEPEDQMVEDEVVEAAEEAVAPPEAEELVHAEQTHQELQHFDDDEINVHEDAVDESDAEILSEPPWLLNSRSPLQRIRMLKCSRRLPLGLARLSPLPRGMDQRGSREALGG